MLLPPIPLEDPENVVKLDVKFKPPVMEDKVLLVGPRVCSHFNTTYVVDESLSEVTCSQCKQKLNPMFVLTQLAHKERRWHEAAERYQEEMKRLKERSRTKCEHCTKMTRISNS